jgi:RNA polymerase sigma-70 factor (ECF subfamily)
VQEAYAAALRAWGSTGIPANPAAWLTTTARRRAIDAIRREAALRSRLPLLVEPGQDPEETSTDETSTKETSTEEAAVHELAAVAPSDAIPDERLRLIFTCCHPALAQDAQVALTLRLLCGIPTADIARSFLVPEPTMAARTPRAGWYGWRTRIVRPGTGRRWPRPTP